jgi:hypothetical protein
VHSAVLELSVVGRPNPAKILRVSTAFSAQATATFGKAIEQAASTNDFLYSTATLTEPHDFLMSVNSSKLQHREPAVLMRTLISH